MMKFYIILTLIRLTYGAFDADVDICEDPQLDAAVFYENHTYIFKGKYFWRTHYLTNSSGIVGYAKPITHKWPEIIYPLTGIFTIMSEHGITTTFFVTSEKWFAYINGRLNKSDSITSWPKFPRGTTNVTTFSIDGRSSQIYILYDSCKKYQLYDFENYENPILRKSGRTVINGNFVWFFEDNPFEGDLDITDLVKVDVVLSYKNALMFLSKHNYCKVNLTNKKFERECKADGLTSKLLGCPLDVSKRPVTVPEIIKKTTTVKPLNETRIPTNISLITEEPISETLFGNSSEAAAVEQIKKKRKSSAFWVLIITGILILVVVACIIAIAVIVNKGRKRNASKLYISNDRNQPRDGMGKDGEMLVEDPSTGSLKASSAKQSYKLNSISTKTTSKSKK